MHQCYCSMLEQSLKQWVRVCYFPEVKQIKWLTDENAAWLWRAQAGRPSRDPIQYIRRWVLLTITLHGMACHCGTSNQEVENMYSIGQTCMLTKKKLVTL
jgi:hypothetical protein